MRVLHHPALEDITVEGIMHALSDPLRVAIFADIAGAKCAMTCSNFLQISKKGIPKSTLSQHFKVLREAGLIRSERQGVELHNTSRCAEIHTRFPNLIAAILDAHRVQSEKTKEKARRRA
jgi:DNA-binding transcriptional ArsR family regulator